MERSTIIALLVVVGLGGLVWYLMIKSDDASGGQPLPKSCGTGMMGDIGTFIQGHVARKNALAPTVASKFGVPAGTAAPITAIAGKLSPSGWLEQKIGDWICDASFPSASTIASNVYNTAIKPGVTLGTSQLKAGTIAPIKSLYSAGSNLVHGNFGDAAGDVAKSVYEGPKAALSATKNLLSDINPF